MAELQAMRDVLTVDEIADYLRVSRATICRWCGAGKLPAFKIGKSWRVQRSDLEGYIRRQRDAMPDQPGLAVVIKDLAHSSNQS